MQSHHRVRATVLGTALSLIAAHAALGAQPNVVSTVPVRHTFAPAGTAISVTFDQALQTSSIDSSSFRVFGRATGTATGTVAFSNGNQTLTFTPSKPFSAGETVLVNLSHDVHAADATPMRSAGFAFEFIVRSQPAALNFQQIDVMSNRKNGVQTRIYGAVQADLDRDGWIDLATVNEVSADLRVFLNRGDGSGLYQQPFLAPVPVGVESSPNEPGDFDNDGKIDIAVSATESGGVWIVHGKGDGTFSGSQSVLTGNQPHGVAVLDVDGDGDMDIVDAVAGDSTLALLLNDGSGTFSDPPTFFDPGCSNPWGMAAADMDNDGITDLVVGCVGNMKATVVRNNGDGTLTAGPAQNAAGPPWQVAVGDVDGDGNMDAALANAGGAGVANGALLRGNGDGTLAAPVTVAMPDHTPASDLGDLDGDGDLDWVLSSYSAGLWRIYLNDGAGHFSFNQDIEAPSNPSCAVLVDFDNDGDIDLALSDEIADVVVLMQNTNGPSTLCPPAPATCRTTVQTAKSSFQLKDKMPDTGDQLVWKWAGQATAKADFGDPPGSDDYALCLYDGGSLVASATAAHGGTCAGKPCWTAKPTSYAYRNKALVPTGTQSIQLKEGLIDGKAKIVFKGKGGPLVMPAPSAFAGPLAVRLHRSGAATCWGSDFSAPFLKQDGSILKDKSD